MIYWKLIKYSEHSGSVGRTLDWVSKAHPQGSHFVLEQYTLSAALSTGSTQKDRTFS